MPGEPAYDGPAIAQLGIVPQPKDGTLQPITPEPHRGPIEPPSEPDSGIPHPQGSPFNPKPGPKEFAIEGADTNSNAVMLIAVTNAFLAISINPPLYQLLVKQNK
jgi:hypothetical protein